MNLETGFLTDEERIALSLRALYHQYGYTQFKMGKFEEYDLYAQNKDFLISDNVITFTDTNGRLMALKPDVTLSIVRSSRDGAGIHKLWYDENVYRVSRSSRAFREIRQVGLECLGPVDDYSIAEVTLLAMRSLLNVSEHSMLTLSHLDILSDYIRRTGVPENLMPQLIHLIDQKNRHELQALCASCNADSATLMELIAVRPTPQDTLDWLRAHDCDAAALDRLSKLVSVLNENGLCGRFNIDFSIVGDFNYYNGIVFRGYISGIPDAVVSGGQYDKLMRKMMRASNAIGFAVYMDRLERLAEAKPDYDVDMLLIYDESADVSTLCRIANGYTQRGKRVLLRTTMPEKMTWRMMGRLNGSEVEILEDHA